MGNEEMKLIGKGSFTKAYLREDKRVFIKSEDPIKEIMAMGWFPSCKLFPKIEQLDNGYLMEYYPKVSSLKNSLKPKQWEYYKVLRDLFNSQSAPMNVYDSYSHWYKLFNDLPSKYCYLKSNLLEALDACANMGSDVSFEISPRNVSVKNGNLILLDCFYSRKKLKEVNSQ